MREEKNQTNQIIIFAIVLASLLCAIIQMTSCQQEPFTSDELYYNVEDNVEMNIQSELDSANYLSFTFTNVEPNGTNDLLIGRSISPMNIEYVSNMFVYTGLAETSPPNGTFVDTFWVRLSNLEATECVDTFTINSKVWIKLFAQ